MTGKHGFLVLLAGLAAVGAASAADSPGRARELGIATLLGGVPGEFDAITDVPGVEVGHSTIIKGDDVRTGVTVIHPRGRAGTDAVFAAWYTLNGNGEMTGTTWIEESGFLEGPVAITNTHSVGVVRDAILKWQVSRPGLQPWGLPVVAETYDGGLNDINGFHVKDAQAFEALDNARGGPVAEGNVGGGTGMVCHQFKGGIGTASRVVTSEVGKYTVGVLVQCNYGVRERLQVAGVNVGRAIPDLMPCSVNGKPNGRDVTTPCADAGKATGQVNAREAGIELGSIIVVVATDAPLLPHQLKRLARRVSLGIGRMGGLGGNSSGDIFVAFSTANASVAGSKGAARAEFLPNAAINPLFEGTVQATEEAIVNALLAARTMTGGGLRVYSLPHDRLLEALKSAQPASPRQ